MNDYLRRVLDRITQENIQRGVCVDCGGSGVVAAMAKIARTGDPHANRRCSRCRGTGKPVVTKGPDA